MAGIDSYVPLMLHFDGPDGYAGNTPDASTAVQATSMAGTAQLRKAVRDAISTNLASGTTYSTAQVRSSKHLFTAGNHAQTRQSQHPFLPTGTSTPSGSVYAQGTVQINTTTKKFGTGACYFDGAHDFITSDNHTDFDISTGDWTIDFWVYFNSLTGEQVLCEKFTGTTAGWTIYKNPSTHRITFYRDSAAVNITSTAAVVINTWYHVAVVRYGNIYTVYLNGVPGTPATVSGSMTNQATTLKIGSRNGTASFLNGYMDEYRFSKGIARWTADFSGSLPSDYTTDAYTMALLHFDGTEGSQQIDDSSGASPAQKFGIASLYFDGTDDYITHPDSGDFEFGSGDFTVELWVKFLTNATNRILVDHWGASGNYGYQFYTGTGTLRFSYSTTGTDINTQSVSWTPTMGQWYHLAVVRSGSNLIFFIDGVGTVLSISGSIFATTATMNFGYQSSTSVYYFNGYMDEIRISKGIARWISNFSGSLPLVEYDTLDQYTMLLMHCNGANFGTYFPDEVPAAKFGTGAAYFNGVNDFLAVNYNPEFNIGTSNAFTIDMWIHPIAFGTYTIFMSQMVVLATDRWVFWANGTTLTFTDIASGISISGGTLTLNSWQHIAVVRDASNNWYLFLNGVKTYGPTVNAANITPKIASLEIGRQNAAANYYYFNGFVDEVRFSNGIARWTADFSGSLPSSEYTTDSYTKLLLHCNGNDRSIYFPDEVVHPQVKFGLSSVLMDGNSDYVTAVYSTDFEPGAGNFTIDFWAYPVSESGIQTFFCFNTNFHMGLSFNELTRNVCLYASANGTSWDLVNGAVAGKGTTSITLNTWTHIAVVRNGNNWRTYINGVKDVDITASGTVFSRSDAFNIGRWGGGVYFYSGFIDEFRMSMGVARWTSSPFDVPTSQYSRIYP